MQYRQLGRSGLKVSAITLGTMTFGGKGKFAFVGNTDQSGATRIVDISLDAGVNMLDTSDQYSTGTGEEMVGKAIAGQARADAPVSDQGALSDGPRPERYGVVASSSDARL